MERIDALINEIAGTDLNFNLGLASATEAELEAVITALTSLDALDSTFSNAWLTQMKGMMGNQTLAAFLTATNPILIEGAILKSGADAAVQNAMRTVYTAFMAAL